MQSFLSRRTLLALACVASLNVATVSEQPFVPGISAPVEASFQRVLAAPAVKAALTAIEADDERTLLDQIALTEVSSPPFKEAMRAAGYAKRLKALGFADARVDNEGNVISVRVR